MDSLNALTPLYSPAEARVTPIAELCPDLPDPRTKAVRGVVTITWPYNSVKGTFAFNLAEPDFRLRRNKGQVRIDFTGRAAKATGGCGLGSNDEVLLSLEGAAWEAAEANKRQSLPGADLGWRLVFSEKLSLKILRAETGDTVVVTVDEQTPSERETVPNPTSTQPFTVTKSPSSPTPLSPIHITSPFREIRARKLDDGELTSPAFIKRARMSYGSLFEGDFDILEDDGGVKGMGRKRTRFGRDSSAWRYTSQSPSPEPAATSPGSVEGHVSSPARVEMADEGCQTMELDRPSPQHIETPSEALTAVMLPKQVPIDDAPANTPVESAIAQSAQAQPLDSWSSASIVQNEVTLTSSEVLHSNVDVPLPLSGQQLSSAGYNFAGGSWNADIAPSSFEPQQQEPFSPLHVEESFSSSGFGNMTSATQPDDSDGLSKSQTGDGENTEPIDNGIIRPTESSHPAVNYPPPDVTEDTHSHPIHDEALTDYPASYLDDSHTSRRGQMVGEQTPEYPATVRLGSSSWATVNHNSQATAMPPTDRLGSRDGDTPEQALIIDESESDDESAPEPVAVEDTVNSGRAYALGLYEDAEAEDEVDAQYSDDDEPEYDADEMGGDYDTRNYEQPGDDEDDSHDEDLRPHPLEPEFPEFDDGESWDEEDQDELLDEEEEGDYEMDGELAEPAPQPVVRSIPTVIDLISSSEDESEDEDEGEGDDTMTDIQRSGTHIVSRTSSSHQESVAEVDLAQERLSDEEAEINSEVAVSEADISSETRRESNEYMSSCEEEEEEEDEEDEIYDENEVQEYEQEDIPMSEPSRNEGGHEAKPETEFGRLHELEGDAPLDDTEDHHNDITSRQTSPRDELHESIRFERRMDILEGKDSATIPLSAADGLEMLSRVLDDESNANSTRVFSETVEEEIVLENISEKQSLAKSSEEGDVQVHDPSNQQEKNLSEEVLEELFAQGSGDDQVDLIALSKIDNEHRSPVINDSESTAAAPTSPPLTQSFQSRTEVDADSTFEETTVSVEAQVSTTQLPTPQETQITDIVLNNATSTQMDIGESFETITIIEKQDFEATEDSISAEPVYEVLQQEISMDMDQDDVKQHGDIASVIQDQGQTPLGELSAAASPAHSFQTQIDDGELASPGSVEQTMDDDHVPYNLSSGHDQSTSFTSHMEVDEELQASILENSQVEEKPLGHHAHDDEHEKTMQDDEHDETIEKDAHEDTLAETSSGVHIGSRQTRQAEVASSPLHEQFVVEILTIQEDEHDEVIQDDTNEDTLAEATSGVHVRSEQTRQAEVASSPSHEQLVVEIPSSTLREGTPGKQATEISAQLIQNFIENESSPTENSDTSPHDDPSVRLARVVNASKRATKSRDTSTELHRPHTRALDARRSPTPETENSSVQLARASFVSQPPKHDEDSYSMTAAKLQLVRHLRDELPDCTSLKVLRQHLTKSLDVIAVAMMQPPEPRRAKGGPRAYMMSFTITDHSIGPYAVAEVLISRPHKDTLPVVKYGDIVLLRNFTVVSLANKGFGLKTNDGSSWAVFDHEGEPAQINGPPVEYGEKEIAYVSYLREWFGLLGDSAKAKLERANQKIINAGKAK
ncbi:hypothetical protein HD806DRAFT_502012 [Xylariaceae sp. AK1471]|nr:hypothetical protein HD806DRAFT_502012 [Xylariaceae sp. AK1471]